MMSAIDQQRTPETRRGSQLAKVGLVSDHSRMRLSSHFATHLRLRTAAMLLAVTGFLSLGACSMAPADRASDYVLRSPVFVKVADQVFKVRVAEVQLVTKRDESGVMSYYPRDEDTGKFQAEKLARDASRSSAPVSGYLLVIVPTSVYEGRPPNIECISWRCRSGRAGVANDLPARFFLVDPIHLRQLESYKNGDKNVFELLSVVEPFDIKPKVSCPKQDGEPSVPAVKAPMIVSSCYAVMKLFPRVLAVWPLSVRRPETAEGAAARQGRALALASKRKSLSTYERQLTPNPGHSSSRFRSTKE